MVDGYSVIGVNVLHNGRYVITAVVEVIFDELLLLLDVESHTCFFGSFLAGLLSFPSFSREDELFVVTDMIVS